MTNNVIKKINTLLAHVKLTDKLFFTKNLNLMIRSGIPIVQSLQSLLAQTENLKMKLILQDITERIQKGQALSQALLSHPKIFSDIFVNMIKAGEESGKLEDVLRTLTIQLYKEHDLKSKVKSALAYPTVVLIAMISITVGLIVFVIPKLTQMFIESGMDLPLSTRILIGLSTFVTHYFYLFIVLVVGGSVGFLKIRRTYIGQKVLHKIILKFPIFSKLAVKVNIARCTRSLSSLLRTDIPVVRSFTIVADVMGNIYYREALKDIAEQLKAGTHIHTAVSRYETLFTPTLVQMVAVGEETGKLDEILEEIAEFYEEELDTNLKNLPALLEPLLILFLGGTVGGIALAIMLPIFSFTRNAANS